MRAFPLPMPARIVASKMTMRKNNQTLHHEEPRALLIGAAPRSRRCPRPMKGQTELTVPTTADSVHPSIHPIWQRTLASMHLSCCKCVFSMG